MASADIADIMLFVDGLPCASAELQQNMAPSIPRRVVCDDVIVSAVARTTCKVVGGDERTYYSQVEFIGCQLASGT